MNFRKLKIFFETAKYLNMTRVAKDMYISQPSVSQAIFELEDSLEVKLFDRIGKKLYLTHEGEIYFQYVRRILNLYEEGNEAIKISKKGSKGKIVIGASTTIGIYILPNIIKKFNEENKDIEISLIIENTLIIEKLIMENKVDFAFIEGNITYKEILSKEVWKDKLIFISNPKNSLTKREDVTICECLNDKFIMREIGSGTRDIIESYLKSKGCNYHTYMELGNTEAIIRVVEAGLGISCVSHKCVREQISNGSIKEIKIKGFNIERSLQLIYHKDKLISKNMEIFIDYLMKYKN